MKLNKIFLLIPVFMVLLFFLIGCDGVVLPIPVTGVSIQQDDFFQIVIGGEPYQLTAEVEPSNATNKAVTWSSSNPEVATVNANGLVTGVDDGVTTITVTTVDGGFADSVQIEAIYIFQSQEIKIKSLGTNKI